MSTNPFKLLRDLLPVAPLLVGDVLFVVNGVATIEVPGGGRQTARGNAVMGQRVYFRDQMIEGLAPTLPIELITL